VRPRRLQQHERADHVGPDEIGRTVDRAIDVALGREVHHRVGVVRGEHLAHRRGISDVGLHQDMAVMVPSLLERILGGGVGHFVDVDHDVAGLADQMADHGGADEPATSGQQQLHSAGIPSGSVLPRPGRQAG